MRVNKGSYNKKKDASFRNRSRIVEKSIANNHYSTFLKKISIKVIDNPVKTALEEYNKTSKLDDITYDDDNRLLTRLTLNYIRHCCTNYNILLVRMHNLPIDFAKFKNMVNNAIIKKYKNNLLGEKYEDK